ncbi:MAG TPA: ADP-ribosylation factor-like protein [Methanobacterium sp.]|nr:ADP-ribosylation factor-like protein [Methanobacterium sp.]
METKKILVLGDSESGKKTALEHICDNLIKTEAVSYGKALMNSKKISIFSPSGAQRFRFMKDILSKNMDGAIIFIDNTQGMTSSCVEMIDFVKEKAVPCVIFANKQDLNDNPLNTNPADIPVVPTQAISGKGVTTGLNTLLELMEHDYGSGELKA